jgi:branched-chain amino acid transport system permease protein
MLDLTLQFLVNGLVVGAFYALSALGLTLILGQMQVVNFAHGEFYMMGGIIAYYLTAGLGLDFFAAIVVVVVVMAAFGWLVDRALIRPLRGQDILSTALVTIGLSIFLVNTFLLLAGTAPRKIATPFSTKPILLGPVVINEPRIFAVCVAAAAIAGTHLLIHHTRLGRAMRATFQNKEAAALVGIEVERIYGFTFALGTVMAAISGVLLGSIYVAQPTVGGLISLKAFVVVILGGMGSFAGAVFGGLILGVAESLWGGLVSAGYQDVIGFAFVIAILLVRPYGLFHAKVERV